MKRKQLKVLRRLPGYLLEKEAIEEFESLFEGCTFEYICQYDKELNQWIFSKLII